MIEVTYEAAITPDLAPAISARLSKRAGRYGSEHSLYILVFDPVSKGVE